MAGAQTEHMLAMGLPSCSPLPCLIGFSRDQFSGGNEVVLRSTTMEFPCDVIPYYSRADPNGEEGEDLIVCDTRYVPLFIVCTPLAILGIPQVRDTFIVGSKFMFCKQALVLI